MKSSLFISVVLFSFVSSSFAVAKTTVKAAPKAVSTPWAPIVEDGKVILEREINGTRCTISARQNSFLFLMKGPQTWANPMGHPFGVILDNPWVKTNADNDDIHYKIGKYYSRVYTSQSTRDKMYIMAICDVPDQEMVTFMGKVRVKPKKTAKK